MKSMHFLCIRRKLLTHILVLFVLAGQPLYASIATPQGRPVPSAQDQKGVSSQKPLQTAQAGLAKDAHKSRQANPAPAKDSTSASDKAAQQSRVLPSAQDQKKALNQKSLQTAKGPAPPAADGARIPALTT